MRNRRFVINKKKKTEAPKEDEWADLPEVIGQKSTNIYDIFQDLMHIKSVSNKKMDWKKNPNKK